MNHEETKITKEEARQGQRILGMPSTLAASIAIALVGMVILLAIFR
ncbi:MAG: hypothetical protein RH945_02370 [Hyphomonas sp.]|tara:strand:+ start:2006 stop:2143 length:138 start_codon:yes stop_codon:yes gene_type:complete